MFELLAFGLVIGFVCGYFSNNWLFTKKVAGKLDELLGNKNNKE